MPWSSSPFAPYFDRRVPTPGNGNTPNVSNYSERENLDQAVISSSGSANLKILIQLAKEARDDVSLFSIDTGMHGNPFQGAGYFDFNKDHLEGRLKRMKWNEAELAEA